MVKAIVGANWGDEGKGKITDLLAKNADVVVRFQGGSNAGHTIINEYGRFALHQLPSGIFNSKTTNVIGNGVALNVDYLMKELESVASSNVKINLLISDKAQLLMPYHVLFDNYEEDRLGDKKFGSTKSGIAPLYSDKYSKTGIQVGEIYDNPYLEDKVKNIVEKVNVIFKHLYNKPEINYKDVMETINRYGELIKDNVTDTSKFLRDAIDDNKNILLEGQLGSLKDTDHGIYPYVTSSSTLAGYASIGAGIPPYEIKSIVAVTKAYSTAVGEGPFVSELFDEVGDDLRVRGGDKGEYGATTGRPRRIGWFDIVATKYGAKIQGATEVAITGIDVLSGMKELKICTGYEIDGKITTDFPNTTKLYQSKPVLETVPGWTEDIRGITEYDKLPQQAKDYVSFIEKRINTKIKYISTGPERDEIIYL